jgi:hypothetical protein
MATLTYTAYPTDGIHKAECGEVVADTLEEAEQKVQAIFPYPVLVKLPTIASDYNAKTSFYEQ